ncbi:MAG TPA: prepilin-type N-terminal cleavage/methylation domain-containing protein [Thermoanaerobaculia bacterium]|jgi:Tfp pilus assembly protein PilV|nr:prepilin-type N-terminal cleavage/methylation domain-containing protein [Thermoanaerobaculia bacterium]
MNHFHTHSRILRRGREAGLTLVELLISMALLGFVLLGIAPLFIASVKSNYSAFEYTSIHNLARDRLEQLMNLPFTDAQLNSGSFLNDLPTTLPDPVTGIPPSTMKNTLSRTYTVQNFTSTPPVTSGDPYTLNTVGAGTPCQFKRIDVTVTSSSINPPSPLGIGQRTARVSGFVRNLNTSAPCS